MGDCRDKSEISALILRVRSGDGAAFEELLCRYTPLLDAAVARFSSAEHTKPYADDLRQESTIVFYNAILNYDIDNEGVEFGLYAKICVTNMLRTQHKMLNRVKTEQLPEDADSSGLAAYDEPASAIIEHESLNRIDNVIRGNLSSFEYRVWCLYASGKTAKDIGVIVGKSEKSVSNAVYRIRKKLRELLK